MYEYEPVAFVRKEKLRGDICCGLQQYFAAMARKRICVRSGDGCSYKEVLIRDIVYVECGGRTLHFWMRSGDVFQIRQSLRSIQEELAPYKIYRTGLEEAMVWYERRLRGECWT